MRDGAFFRLNDYVHRFFASMAALQRNPNINKQQVQDALIDTVAASAMRESYVAMEGVPKIARSRAPRNCRNHFYAWCMPYVHVIKPEIVASHMGPLTASYTGFRHRCPYVALEPVSWHRSGVLPGMWCW